MSEGEAECWNGMIKENKKTRQIVLTAWNASNSNPYGQKQGG